MRYTLTCAGGHKSQPRPHFTSHACGTMQCIIHYGNVSSDMLHVTSKLRCQSNQLGQVGKVYRKLCLALTSSLQGLQPGCMPRGSVASMWKVNCSRFLPVSLVRLRPSDARGSGNSSNMLQCLGFHGILLRNLTIRSTVSQPVSTLF